MQCNQSFCGNGFTNGPFYSSCNAPLQCTQTMYPEIVGEGEVTSIILPDGSMQFFFMPTLKWWAPHATQCHPYATVPNPMFANINYNIPPCNNNVGTWFIRSISNPLPQNMFNLPCQRNEVPRLSYYNSDYNNIMNSNNIGYKVKFHNDIETSTTDLVYFYPSLRQHDFVFIPPCKNKTVQIDTLAVANNTVGHSENVCSKPCNCCVGAKPMSLESLVKSKSNTKSNNASTDDCSCDDISKNRNKRRKNKKNKRNKSKNLICACDCESTAKIDSVDKSVTTYTDKGSSCTPADGRETQTCRREVSKCSVGAKPMSLESLVEPKLTTKSKNASLDECSRHDISKKRNKRDKNEKNKRNKSNSNCNCDLTANNESVDKLVETYIHTDEGNSCTPADGCGTPCSKIKLKKSNFRKVAQKSSSKKNAAFQQLKSDYDCQKCEVAETWVPTSSLSKRMMEGKSSENLLDSSCNYCDYLSNCSSSGG